MGTTQNQPFQVSFNASLKADFQGSRVTSDGGLIWVRVLDKRLGFNELIKQHLADSRGENTQLPLADLLPQSVLPRRIDNWSLTSLQQRLVKTGGGLIKDARDYWSFLAESHVKRRLFVAVPRRIEALPVPSG